jgi:hypothetical protein
MNGVLTWSLAVNATFAGLRSRWMIPFSCASSSASAIWRAITIASSTGMGPRFNRSASVYGPDGCVGGLLLQHGDVASDGAGPT